MSDFVNTLHKFCSSHQQPPQGMAFGGKMQLCVYMGVTARLGLGEHWDYDFVEETYPPRMGRIANDVVYTLSDVVASICSMLTFSENCSVFSKETVKADLAKSIKSKPNLYALEYALALISYKVGGSQKRPPAKLTQKFENGKLEKDFERLLSKWAFSSALRIVFSGHSPTELTEVLPRNENWTNRFIKCLDVLYVLLDKATDEMVAALKNPSTNTHFELTAVADLSKEEQEDLLYDALTDSARYFKQDILSQIVRDLHQNARAKKFINLLERGSASDDNDGETDTLTFTHGDDFCIFAVRGKVIKNKVILTYKLTTLDSDDIDSSIEVPDFLYGKEYVTGSI